MVRTRMAIRRKVRSRSRLTWAGLTVAPWCMAAGLLVSFVADAGQDPVIGATRMDLTDMAAPAPADLIPLSTGAAGSFVLPGGTRLLHEARLVVGDPDDIEPAPDETDPKLTLKSGHTEFPAIDRSHRSDPLVALRPTFDTQLRRPGSLPAFRRDGMTFADGDPAAPALTPPDLMGDMPEFGTLTPLPDPLAVTTRQSEAEASPKALPDSETPQVLDGSTPGVGRAISLGSTTPAASDDRPVEIGALPKWSRGPNGLISGNTIAVGIVEAHPDYAALIDMTKADSEQRCLAQAIYFEARSEPEEGQAAVAQVVLNRVRSGLYPASVCGVVFQNQQHRNACQFSFVCEGHALHVNEMASWASALRIAREVTEGSAYVSDVGGATHYHANYVRPPWARQLTRMDAIGHHIFYKLKPGQT